MPESAGKAVFLSYASQDAEVVQNIATALRAAGVEVWFDRSELRGGDAWDQKIRRQIKECALFVPVISATTQARAEGYFRREWKLAVDRTHDMADHIAFLVPVVIDETPDATAFVPEKFREVQWTRLRSADAAAAFAGRVVTLLGGVTPAVAMLPAPNPPVASEVPAVPPASRRPASPPKSGRPKGKRVAVLALLALGVAAALAWSWQRMASARRVRDVVVPEVERLIAARNLGAAFDLAIAAEREAPADSALKLLWPRVAWTTAVESTPAGADVYVKEYYKPQSEWRHLGKTPLRDVRLPKVYTRWKIQKEGFGPLERALSPDTPAKFELEPAAAIPAEMVKVGAGSVLNIYTGLPTVKLEAFLIDRHEVTNRQFKAFVDQQGYQNRALWRQPFVRAGQTLSLDQALTEFRDGTGQPGPATWKNGTYAENEADLPVTGVSWYEAAAYAEFVGKRLPSIYHWRVAAQVAPYESLVPLSNFSGRSLAPVGTYQGMSEWGAYDMAGNAKEWCWNAAGGDTRYLLGGTWREASYAYTSRDPASPFDRSAHHGFRCIKLLGNDELPKEIDAEMAIQLRNYAVERPVSDEVYQAIRSAYYYDKSALDARIEGVEDADPRWRLEKVSLRAAYGNERVPASVFLPKNSAPPFQGILYFPSAAAQTHKSLAEDTHDMAMIAMLVASGRAVICPIYKGTFERYERFAPGTALSAWRDQLVMVAKDIGRSIDYLETRSDLQTGKLAFFGYSAGGTIGTILPAIEQRLKASVLVAAGFTQGKVLPEADPINFAPRNTAPALMINGRFDFIRPVETSQTPMFRLLGAPAEHKRHTLFDTGHTLRPEQIAGEVYVWLDRYLGLVR